MNFYKNAESTNPPPVINFMKPLEENLHQMDKLIAANHLISATAFPLNSSHSKTASIGLCSVINFQIIIKLWGSQQVLPLTVDEWQSISKLDFASVTTDVHLFNDITISKKIYMERWIYTISKRECFVLLSNETLKNLLSYTKMINSKINVLKSQNFESFLKSLFARCGVNWLNDIEANILDFDNANTIAFHELRNYDYKVLEKMSDS